MPEAQEAQEAQEAREGREAQEAVAVGLAGGPADGPARPGRNPDEVVDGAGRRAAGEVKAEA